MFLLSHYQQKLIKNYQNFLVNNLKYQCIGMNIKQKQKQNKTNKQTKKKKKKRENKNTTNENRYFLASNFAAINRLFVSVYLNGDNDVKS